MDVQAPRRLDHHKVRRAVALAKGNYGSVVISFGITLRPTRAHSMNPGSSNGLYLIVFKHFPGGKPPTLFLKML